MRIVLDYLKAQAGNTAHKGWVAYYLVRYAASASPRGERRNLLLRAARHDVSKYRWDEANAFAAHRRAHRLGQGEVAEVLAAFERQVELHHARNRHHPEHHRGGYRAMGQVDKVEMVADWAASARRRHDGDVGRWICRNATRYGYGEREGERLRGIARRMGAL